MADGRVIVEAILDTSNVAKGVSSLKSDLNGISWDNIKNGDEKAQALGASFKSAGTACMAGLTAPIVAAGTAALGVASSYEQSTSQIQAALGLTREEAERFKDVGASIYEGGWGDSMDDVTEALLTVKQNFKDLDDASLQNITESALMLRDTFGMDVSESIRGAENLATGFGISGEKAMDLITVAAQHGLNSTDELGDNLAEYATLFEENGYSAEQMFSVLEAGLDAGAYNLDKVNDLVKEFGIRIADGSIEKAVTDLGGSFEETFNKLKSSGASNQEIFTALAQEISKCGSEQEKAAAVSAIFGSMGEDAGFKVIEAMGQAADSYDDVAGAADRAKEAAGDNFANQMASAGRTIMGALEPLGEPLLNIAKNVAGLIKSFGEWFSGFTEGGQMVIVTIGAIAAAIGPALIAVGSIIPKVTEIMGVIGKVKTVISGIGSATGVASGALGGLSKAFSFLTGPVGIVIAIVGALVAAFIWAYNNVEPFRNAIDQLVSVLGETFGPIIQQIGDFITTYILPAFSQLAEFLGGILLQAFTVLGEFITTYVIPGFQMLCDFITTYVIPGLQMIGEFIVGTIGPAFQMLCDFVVTYIIPAFQQFADFVSAIMPTVLEVIQTVLGTILSVFQDVLGTIFSVVSDIFTGIWNHIQNIMNTICGVIEGAWNVIQGIFNTVLGLIIGLVTGDFAQMQDGINQIMDGISQIISSIWQGICDTVGNILSTISSVVGDIWNGISSVVSDVCNGISSVVGSVWNGIASTISGIVNSILGAISSGFNAAYQAAASAFNGIANAVSSAMNWVLDIVNSVASAIGNAFSWISNTASSIGSFIGGLFGISAEGLGVPVMPVPGELPPIDPATLPINWYATGGVFAGPSVIGVGEAGKEAVIPLNGSAMAPFAEAVADSMKSDQPGVNVTIHIDQFVNQSDADLDELVERVERDINRKVARSKRAKG